MVRVWLDGELVRACRHTRLVYCGDLCACCRKNQPSGRVRYGTRRTARSEPAARPHTASSSTSHSSSDSAGNRQLVAGSRSAHVAHYSRDVSAATVSRRRQEFLHDHRREEEGEVAEEEMAIGCGANCAKILLIIFNFIFWLSGGALVGLGVWLRVDKNLLVYQDLIQVDKSDPFLNFSLYIMIGVGAFVFAVGFFGCCGALRESRCLLGLYIFLLLLVMCGELAGGVLAAIFKKRIEDKLKDRLQSNIRDNFTTTNMFGDAWKKAQIKLACCGAEGPADYLGSKWLQSQDVSKRAGVTPPIQREKQVVPDSCCALMKDAKRDWDDPKYESVAKCQENAKRYFAPAMVNRKVDPEKRKQLKSDTLDAKFINDKGCYEKLNEWFGKHIIIVIIVSCSVAGLELLGFVFAVCLCRAISLDSYKD